MFFPTAKLIQCAALLLSSQGVWSPVAPGGISVEPAVSQWRRYHRNADNSSSRRSAKTLAALEALLVQDRLETESAEYRVLSFGHLSEYEQYQKRVRIQTQDLYRYLVNSKAGRFAGTWNAMSAALGGMMIAEMGNRIGQGDLGPAVFWGIASGYFLDRGLRWITQRDWSRFETLDSSEYEQHGARHTSFFLPQSALNPLLGIEKEDLSSELGAAIENLPLANFAPAPTAWVSKTLGLSSDVLQIDLFFWWEPHGSVHQILRIPTQLFQNPRKPPSRKRSSKDGGELAPVVRPVKK